jgi:multiple sugar transport system ATP-binding protein
MNLLLASRRIVSEISKSFRPDVRSGHSIGSFRKSVVPRVVLEGVSKVFHGPNSNSICALSALSLDIQDKECLVIVGPSGSGKTTALRLIAGLEEPSSGTIEIAGQIVNGVAPKARDVAMVFQNPALYPHMSAYQNLAFGLKLRNWPNQQADARVREIARLLGLTPCLDALPMSLSGGQRQRVAIGRALVRNSGILLLDEPLANVDPQLRAQMRSEIAALRGQFGTTLIYVTHDHLEAMLMGDRVAVLHEGVLQQVTDPSTLYRRPANLFVAGFVGSPPMNLFRGKLSKNAKDFLFSLPVLTDASAAHSNPEHSSFRLDSDARSNLDSWVDKSIVLGLHAEHITCSPVDPQASGQDSLRAKVTSLENTGPNTLIRACYAEDSFVVRGAANIPVRVGEEWAFNLDTRFACVFDPASGKIIV